MAGSDTDAVQAAAFRALVAHLQQRTDVQNIDLMNLAGFCRNCLAKWLTAEAETRGVALSYNQACEQVYGMPYDEWKKRFQLPATEEQLARYEATKDQHSAISREKR
ncbi:MAG: DUF1244 domain-containing protein [bacterium]